MAPPHLALTIHDMRNLHVALPPQGAWPGITGAFFSRRFFLGGSSGSGEGVLSRSASAWKGRGGVAILANVAVKLVSTPLHRAAPRNPQV